MRSSFTPRLGLLTFGHFTIDSYPSFFAPLLPLLVKKLELNLTLVGTLVALASVTSSFSQPLFGLLSDRLRRPWFVAFGPLIVGPPTQKNIPTSCGTSLNSPSTCSPTWRSRSASTIPTNP